MSVISTVEAVPSRLRILYKMLHEAGAKGLTREQIKDAVAPAHLPALAKERRAGQDSDNEESGSNVLEASLRELRSSGLAEIRSQHFFLKEKPQSDLSDEAFLIAIENLFLPIDVSIESENGVLAGAIAWLLTQSPIEGLPWSEAPTARLKDSKDKGEFDITSMERWQNVIHWARFLGYCSLLQIGKKVLVIPDPTVALRRHIGAALPKKKTTVESFLKALASRIPVIEEGTAARAIEARLPENRRRSPLELWPSTILAMRRLVDEGKIDATGVADAVRWNMPGIKDGRISDLWCV